MSKNDDKKFLKNYNGTLKPEKALSDYKEKTSEKKHLNDKRDNQWGVR